LFLVDLPSRGSYLDDLELKIFVCFFFSFELNYVFAYIAGVLSLYGTNLILMMRIDNGIEFDKDGIKVEKIYISIG
jgi:hypothetical protein